MMDLVEAQGRINHASKHLFATQQINLWQFIMYDLIRYTT